MIKSKIILVLLLLVAAVAWGQRNPYDHRGVQYATQGTDFWLCFHPTHTGFTNTHNRLYVVAERDCQVTVTNRLYDFSMTYNVKGRNFARPDTNYIEIPMNVSWFVDSLTSNQPASSQRALQPQPMGLHVTSTDTISLYMFVYASGFSETVNVLPTEMLRDEYITNIYPHFKYPAPIDPVVNWKAGFSVVATEDNTVVDIVLGGDGWAGYMEGDTVTVTLNRNQIYYMGSREPMDKYGRIDYDSIVPILTHSFTPHYALGYLYYVDLSGTKIKARDCKRIAVFECNPNTLLPWESQIDYGYSDYLLEQALPLKFVGTEYMMPNLVHSDTDYIRILGLHDGTTVTILDAARSTDRTRTLTVDKDSIEWFQMDHGEGPFLITASQPVLLKYYSMGCNSVYDGHSGLLDWGDPSVTNILPVEWWHGGMASFGTMTDVDADGNRRTRRNNMHVFTRTADVRSMRIDSYRVDSIFTPMAGTPYSYAYLDRFSQFTSEGVHIISSVTEAPFYVIYDSQAFAEREMCNVAHRQPGNSFLKLNDIYSDSLNPDSIWCMYDPITFKAWCERPADSVWWDLGDGTTFAYSHLDSLFEKSFVHTYQDTGRFEITCIFTYEYDSCFTRKPDTVRTSILIHNHYDSSFAVRICDGAFTFRGHLLDYTDTHYVTTYWTESGCDTLWEIALVTCPHCAEWSDTISTDDLPWYYCGREFNYAVNGEIVRVDIGDDCDSVIRYTLVVIPYWGQPPLDSVFVLVPNVFTPDLMENNLFRIYCSPQIERAQVSVYDRRGMWVASFDGLTGSWDGTHNGTPCRQEAYVYYVRYIDNKDRGWKTLTGTVTLLR